MNEELKIIITAEIGKLKKGVDDAKKQIKTFSEQVKSHSKDAEQNIKKMGDGIKKGLKVAVGGFAAAGVALFALGASTAEYRAEHGRGDRREK